MITIPCSLVYTCDGPKTVWHNRVAATKGEAMLILSAAQVKELVEMREAINLMESALAEFSGGHAVMPVQATTRILPRGGLMLSMPAFMGKTDALGSKTLTIYNGNPQKGLPRILAVILLNDPHTGKVLALVDGTYLTAVRTAAASGAATKYLATTGPKCLGIVGTGVQGHSHLWAMLEVAQVTSVRIYNRSREKAEAFEASAERRFGVPIDIANSAEEAIRGSDLVVLATSSATPVVKWEWFKPGCHINAVGSYSSDIRELDSDTVASSRILVDSRDAVYAECGDILMPLQEGRISRAQAADEIGEVVAGTKPGRSTADQVTLYKGVGMAVEDVAIAALVYRKALARGMGTNVDL